MDKGSFPSYDPFEKTKVTIETKKERNSCFHSTGYYCQLILTNLGVCGVLITYTLLGGLMFLWIERRDDSNLTVEKGSVPLRPTDDFRTKTVENIWEITVSLNILYRENWTRLAGQEITKFQEELVHKLSQDFMRTGAGERPHIEWSFARSSLYSLTVVTTIGFGGFSSRTILGRVATIAYAVVGIPLMLLYLSSIGSVLSRCARGVCSRTLCCCLCSNCGYCCYDEKRMQEKERRMKQKRELEELQKKQEPFYVRSDNDIQNNLNSKDSEDKWSVNLQSPGSILAPLGLCLMIMLIYIIFGASVLTNLEPWSFLDCCYFCFMSLSTINLNDALVFKGNVKDITIWLCSVYILTGLALTAMCFNILHDELLKGLKKQLLKGLNEKKESPKVPLRDAEEPSPDLYSDS